MVGYIVCLTKNSQVFGLVHLQVNDFFEMAPLSTTRGHAYKLYKNVSSATVRCEFFSERVVNTLNNLPNSVDFTNLTRFVRTVKRVDLSGYLRFSYYSVTRPIISIAAVVLLYSCLYTVTVLYVSFRAIVRALCAFLSCSTALFYCELLSITIWSK